MANAGGMIGPDTGFAATYSDVERGIECGTPADARMKQAAEIWCNVPLSAIAAAAWTFLGARKQAPWIGGKRPAPEVVVAAPLRIRQHGDCRHEHAKAVLAENHRREFIDSMARKPLATI
ncbi:MAG: hypothetical protein ABI127_01015 [Dokdonella sp.]